uniref:Uncharacterized protein n=1 Tax=Romanomermis culicivorax TaxID=13658 RepID=A0A915JAX8_ROMCU
MSLGLSQDETCAAHCTKVAGGHNSRRADSTNPPERRAKFPAALLADSKPRKTFKGSCRSVLLDAYDYEKDWPTTGTKKNSQDIDSSKILACKNKCPADKMLDAVERVLQAAPDKFIKADYDKYCPSVTKSVKCIVNCYPKDDKWKKLDAKLGDLVDNQCSAGYAKNVACFKTVHDDKKVAACIAKCASKPPSKTIPIYKSLTAICKQMDCQSKCEKQELLSKCKKEGKDAYAGYIKKKVHLLKSLAWAHYHMDTNKRLQFTDVCYQVWIILARLFLGIVDSTGQLLSIIFSKEKQSLITRYEMKVRRFNSCFWTDLNEALSYFSARYRTAPRGAGRCRLRKYSELIMQYLGMLFFVLVIAAIFLE